MLRTTLIYGAAALAEIAGCFGFWLWLRQGGSAWVLPGALASLVLFAWLLTLVETPAAGRAYAAYGGLYILASLAWLWRIEGLRPDRWDLLGGAICLLGAGVILLGPRTARAAPDASATGHGAATRIARNPRRPVIDHRHSTRSRTPATRPRRSRRRSRAVRIPAGRAGSVRPPRSG